MSVRDVADLGFDPIAVVEAWRARGAASIDPVKFGVIQSMARRAAEQQGEARLLLIQRVEELLAQHAAWRSAIAQADTAGSTARSSALAGLSELVDRLGRSTPSAARASVPPRSGAARPTETPMTATPQPLKAVVEFKDTWSRLRVEHRLRQALAQVPASAGPLNSSHLVNRALQAMRDLSPLYLDAFMSHVDTLQWLEQASGGGDLASRPGVHSEGRQRFAVRGGRKA